MTETEFVPTEHTEYTEESELELWTRRAEVTGF